MPRPPLAQANGPKQEKGGKAQTTSGKIQLGDEEVPAAPAATVQQQNTPTRKNCDRQNTEKNRSEETKKKNRLSRRKSVD